MTRASLCSIAGTILLTLAVFGEYGWVRLALLACAFSLMAASVVLFRRVEKAMQQHEPLHRQLPEAPMSFSARVRRATTSTWKFRNIL